MKLSRWEQNQIVRDDDLDLFLDLNINLGEIENVKKKPKRKTSRIRREGISKRNTGIHYLVSYILKNNTGKILHYLFEHRKLTFSELLNFFNKFRIQKNHETYTKLFFDLILYRDFADDEYKKLINKMATYHVYPIVDFIHILGHRTDNEIELVDNYDPKRYDDLRRFGYNIDLIINESRLLSNKVKTVKELQKILDNDINIVKKHLDECLSNFDYDMMKCLSENNLIKFDKKTVDLICHEENVAGILFILDTNPNISLTRTNIYNLFGIEVAERKKKNTKNKNSSTRKQVSKWRLRRNKENELKRDKVDEHYDDNMSKILQKIGEKATMYFPVKAWNKLIKNKCIKTIEHLVKNGIVPRLDKYFYNRQLNDIIYQDDVTTLEKMIKFKVFDPIKITKNKEFVDLCIIYGLEKMRKYLTNELHMKCTSDLISKYMKSEREYTSYIRKGFKKLENKKIAVNKFVEILAELEYPVSKNDLSKAIENNKYELVEYFIKTRNMKASTDDIDRSLVNNNVRMIKLITPKNEKDELIVNSKNMVDRLIKKTYKIKRESKYKSKNKSKTSRRRRWSYAREGPIPIDKLQTIISKYGCTASNNAMKTAVKDGNIKLIKYLNRKFKLTCEDMPVMNVLDNDMWWFRNRDTTSIAYTDFIFENKDKLKIKDENIDMTKAIKLNLSQYSYSCDRKTMFNMLKKYNYKFDDEDLSNICEHHDIKVMEMYLDQKFELIKDMSEEEKDVEMRKIVAHINRNAEQLNLLSGRIDIDKYMTKKYTNELVSNGRRNGVEYYTVLDKLSDDKFTAYTIEAYLQNNWYIYKKILEKLISKCHNRVTQKCKDIMKTKYDDRPRGRYSRPMKNLKMMCNLINSCENIVYEASADEKIPINDIMMRRRRINDDANDADSLDSDGNIIQHPIDGEIGIINQIEKELDEEMGKLGDYDSELEDASSIDSESDIIDDDDFVEEDEDDISEDVVSENESDAISDEM